MRLIGCVCKRCETFSLAILIGRGFDLLFSYYLFISSFILFYSFFSALFYLLVGVYYNEVTPVPIPNTEVKLIYAEDTCRETDWKNMSMPTPLVIRS